MPERYRPPSPDDLRATLAERRNRLAALEERGTQALSRYDIEIAHGSNADEALATAKWLVGNQIAYYTCQLEPEDGVPQQIDFFVQLAATPDTTEQDAPAITTL